MQAFGINHETAPIEIREKVSFDNNQLPSALLNLMSLESIEEAVILSTCNRTEIYTNRTQESLLQQWLTKHKSLHHFDITPYCYTYYDMDAIRHIMRVAAGLDSMVLGESQILGQMKEAFQTAQNIGTIGTHLKQLFPTVFATSKCIRAQTDIGAHPISIAYAVTKLVKKNVASFSNAKVLLIGAGEMIELVATHLHASGLTHLIIANRTTEKTNFLISLKPTETIELDNIPHYLADIDIIISATSSPFFLLTKEIMENISHHQPSILMIDLAVPRDIDPDINTLSYVNLYNIDDLKLIIDENIKNRTQAALRAEEIIECHAIAFQRKMRIYHASHIISEYRQRLDNIRESELIHAHQQLLKGQDPKMVLEQFGHQLINKIMHHPTVKLREAASEDQCEFLQHMRQLLEI